MGESESQWWESDTRNPRGRGFPWPESEAKLPDAQSLTQMTQLLSFPLRHIVCSGSQEEGLVPEGWGVIYFTFPGWANKGARVVIFMLCFETCP